MLRLFLQNQCRNIIDGLLQLHLLCIYLSRFCLMFEHRCILYILALSFHRRIFMLEHVRIPSLQVGDEEQDLFHESLDILFCLNHKIYQTMKKKLYLQPLGYHNYKTLQHCVCLLLNRQLHVLLLLLPNYAQ